MMGRPTLETLGRLDVRALQRRGDLDGQEHVAVTRQDGRILILSVTRVHQRLVVAPWLRASDPQAIPLEDTPCHYGGTRVWMRCPRCARRCAVLYVVWPRLRCRHCVQWPYRSQSISTDNRQYHKLRALRARLNAPADLSVPIDPALKPTGMHWRTWTRLALQATLLHRRILDRLDRRWSRLVLRHGL
jgi:hypothetical protein